MFAEALEVTHIAIECLDAGKLLLVVEGQLVPAKGLGGLQHKAGGFLDVGKVAGAGGAAGHRGLGGNGHAYHRGFGGGGGLQDAVEVVQVVAIGGDILLGEGEDMGGLAQGDLHEVHQVTADLQNIALHDSGRDGEVPGVDDLIALGGVHREDGVQLVGDFLPVDLSHLHRGVHEGNGGVRTGGGVGADVGGDEHISLQMVALYLHVQQLGSHRQGAQSAVAVGDKADALRTGAQAAQTLLIEATGFRSFLGKASL